jgi:hypothetical protein
MAIGHPPTAREVGRQFAERICGEAVAQALWVRSHRGYVELWLVTAPTDLDAVRGFHETGVALEEQFPELDLRLHVLNRGYYPHTDVAELIPPGAEEIPLRPE